ncbi:MAG: TIGR04013 family B12-binding domain/radical SAM domain-containing protein [Desulfurococcales archaeon]|nr:TIGR04013 family B12-binding domain/radical SAM domain-containing protein [Desulfurococcales archaeon]
MKIAFLYRFLEESRYSLAQLRAVLEKKLLERGIPLVTKSYRNPGLMVSDALRFVEKGYIVFIAYSLLTTILPELLDEIKWVVESVRNKNIHLIAGGSHPTGDPLGTLKLGFETIFHGEAEESLPEYLVSFAQKEDYLKVRGIVTRVGNSPIYTGKQGKVDLNSNPPFPYWEGIFAPIEITRGCIWGCRYCEVPYMHGAVIRHRMPGNILHYAKIFWSSGRKDLRFITPNAFSYGSQGKDVDIGKLCSLLYRLKEESRLYSGRIFMGSFPSEIRPEHAIIGDAVKCLRNTVSNKNVIIGAQSGSLRVLKILNRGHDVDAIVGAVEKLNKQGFSVDVDFIYALPFEEEDDLQDTLHLTERLALDFNARIHAHYFLPLPGTPLEGYNPRDPPQWFMKRLMKLVGRGKLFGDWLKQKEISRRIVELRSNGVIIGLKGWKIIRRL